MLSVKADPFEAAGGGEFRNLDLGYVQIFELSNAGR
jgi:hypothetical protein